MKIENLSPEQVEMLDKMWSLKEIDEFEQWQITLSEPDLQLSRSLCELLILEALDEYSFCSSFPLDEASYMIKNIFQ